MSPSALNFSGTGSTYAQTVTVTVTAPTSTIDVTPDASCGTGSNAIVAISNPTQNGNTFTATVTPQRAGSCNVVVSSPQGGSQTVHITVNTGTVTISRRR